MAFRWFPTTESRLGRMIASQRVRNYIVGALMLAVVVIAVLALRHILHDLSWDDIRAAVKRIGWPRLIASLALTVLSYVVLTGYDVIALRIIGRQVGYPRTALASFTSYIFSHNFGFAVLTGGTARLRVYAPAGLTLGEVAQMMALTGITFWSGVFLLLGIGLIVHPNAFAAEGVHISYALQAGVGAAILLGLLASLVMLHYRGGRAIRLFGWNLVLPTVRLALAQFALAAVDITLATAALFVLVPGLSIGTFPDVLLGYLVAFVSGLLAHAPGGVGVFETVMLVTLPRIDRAALFAALLVYRFVYYLLPLAVGLLLFALHEVGRRRSA